MSRLAIRRDGGLITLTMSGRIYAPLPGRRCLECGADHVLKFGERLRLTAPVARVGDDVEVNLTIDADDADTIAKHLEAYAREAKASLRRGVIVPTGKPPAELEGIVP